LGAVRSLNKKGGAVDERTAVCRSPKHVSITTLKNSLAEHMQQLAKGEGFIITDRSIPVAQFLPLRLDPNDKDLVHLVAAGLMSPPERPEALDEILRKRPKVKDPGGLIRKALRGERGQD
jgi:antitoxin (DNA-binding transcriptional repressor) of toxin-antitoxin stability system